MVHGLVHGPDEYTCQRSNQTQWKILLPQGCTPDLIGAVGKREWKISLKVAAGDEKQAVVVADKLWVETDKLIEELRTPIPKISRIERAKQAGQWAAHHELLDGQQGTSREVIVVSGERVELDSQRDLTIDHIIEEASRQFGVDDEGRPLKLTPEQDAKLQTLLSGKPVLPDLRVSEAAELYLANRLERTDKATKAAVDQFIEHSGDMLLKHINRSVSASWLRWLASTRRQSHETIKRRNGVMKAIFNFMLDEYELDITNPFIRQQIPKSAKKSQSPLPFNKDHLALIDKAILEGRIDQETAALITLLKFTGCRPMEIAGLSKADIQLNETIPHLRLTPNKVRRLKTELSERRVPLSEEATLAIELIFESNPAAYLFSERFHSTDRLTQILNKSIRLAGVPKSNGLVAYSFRHGFIEALKLSGRYDIVGKELVGHAENSSGKDYGANRRPLDQLNATLLQAIKLLGCVDNSEYDASELVE